MLYPPFYFVYKTATKWQNKKEDREYIRLMRNFFTLDERTGRIINDLATWEEEVEKGQFDSPIVYNALERDWLHHWELGGLVPADIKRKFEGTVSQEEKLVIVKKNLPVLSNGKKANLLTRDGPEFVTALSFHIKAEAIKKVQHAEETYRTDLEELEEEKQQAIDSLQGVSDEQREVLRQHTTIQSNLYKILKHAKEAYAKRG